MRALLTICLALSACADGPAPSASVEAAGPDPSARPGPSASPGGALQGATAGALVYVPAYSHVYAGDRRQVVDLAATLSVRNTDASAALRLVSVHYVGSEGQRLRSYLDAPRTLGPLAAAEFVVAQSDRAGGSGASFLVEWTAETRVSDPVVEAVMINTSGQQGISFVTEGRVVAEARAD